MNNAIGWCIGIDCKNILASDVNILVSFMLEIHFVKGSGPSSVEHALHNS
jgi:hypothetical protein